MFSAPYYDRETGNNIQRSHKSKSFVVRVRYVSVGPGVIHPYGSRCDTSVWVRVRYVRVGTGAIRPCG